MGQDYCSQIYSSGFNVLKEGLDMFMDEKIW